MGSSSPNVAICSGKPEGGTEAVGNRSDESVGVISDNKIDIPKMLYASVEGEVGGNYYINERRTGRRTHFLFHGLVR